MEGNFRIVQLAHSEFAIEKQLNTGFPWYKKQWRKVDSKGVPVHYYKYLKVESDLFYKTSDLEVAKNRLEQIKKYPLVVKYATL